MNILALDIGQKRTGASFVDTSHNVPVPLPTIHHTSRNTCITSIIKLINERSIDHVVIGMPYLLSGAEGKQARYIRGIVRDIPFPKHISYSYIDERYSSPREKSLDADAEAALVLLQMYLDKNS